MAMIHRVLRSMIFFPSVTFKAISAEIFPWATIWVFLNKVRFKLSDILVLFLFTFWAIIGLYSHPPSQVASTFASYINPLLAFIIVLNSSNTLTDKIYKTIKFIFPIFCGVAILQFVGLLTIFEPLFEFLIPRGEASIIGGGRGVSIFSSEPSRASVELSFMYGILIAYQELEKSSRFGNYLCDALFGILIILVIKSATGFLFYMVLIGVRRPFFIWPSILLVFLLAAFFTIQSRVIILLLDIYTSGSMLESIRFLVSQSGFRILSVVSSYVYGYNNIISEGIGSWSAIAVDSYKLAGFTPSDVSYFGLYHNGIFVNLKPTAYAAIIALECGLLSVLLFCFYLQTKLRLFIQPYDRASLAVVIMFLLYVFFIGAVGNPIPWICAALAIRANQRKML